MSPLGSFPLHLFHTKFYFQFTEKLGDVENSEIPCQAWTNRMPKYAQPDLNFIGNVFFKFKTILFVVIVQ